MNPSCQIVPVVNLSSEIMQLKKDNSDIKNEITSLKLKSDEKVELLNGEITQLKAEKIKSDEKVELLTEQIKQNKLIFDYQISQINSKWKEKFGEDITQLDDEQCLHIQIENSFKAKMSPITNEKELTFLNDLFKQYEKGMNEFINVNENDKLEIDPKNDIWQKNLIKK